MEELIEITYQPPCQYKVGDWVVVNRTGHRREGIVLRMDKKYVRIACNGRELDIERKYVRKG